MNEVGQWFTTGLCNQVSLTVPSKATEFPCKRHWHLEANGLFWNSFSMVWKAKKNVTVKCS